MCVIAIARGEVEDNGFLRSISSLWADFMAKLNFEIAPLARDLRLRHWRTFLALKNTESSTLKNPGSSTMTNEIDFLNQ